MPLQAIGFFCDDIREEKNGQLTIVGVLPDNVSITPPPADAKPRADGKHNALLPKLGLYIRLSFEPTEEGVGPFHVTLIMPDGTELPVGEIQAKVLKEARDNATKQSLPMAGVVHHAVFQGFRMPSPGMLLAALDAEGTPRRICATLKFVVEPSASEQPALQSPTAS